MHTYINMNFPKTKAVSSKTPLFVIGQIVLIILFVLTLDFDEVVLHGNVVFSVVVLSNSQTVLQFFKKKLSLFIKVVSKFK